jgi:hypothetical protein
MAKPVFVICALEEVVDVGTSNDLRGMPTWDGDRGVFAGFLDTTVIVDASFVSHFT